MVLRYIFALGISLFGICSHGATLDGSRSITRQRFHIHNCALEISDGKAPPITFTFPSYLQRSLYAPETSSDIDLFVSNLFFVGTELRGIELSPQEFAEYGDRLADEYPTLEHIGIVGVRTDDDLVSIFSNSAIRRFKSLKVKGRLGGVNESEGVYRALGAISFSADNLSELDLSQYGLSYLAIAQILKGTPHLKSLKLSHYRQLTSQDVRLLAVPWVFHPRLFENIETLHIGPTTGEHLDFLQQTAKHLKELSLTVDLPGLEQLGVKTSFPELSKLQVTVIGQAFPFGSVRGGFTSWKEAPFLVTLKRLRIFAAFDESSTKDFCEIPFVALESLELSHCQMGENISVLTGGRHFGTVKRLTLSSNHIKKEGWTALGNGSAAFPNLTHLDLRENSLSETGLKGLLANPAHFPRLQVLSVGSGVYLPSAPGLRAVKAMQRSRPGLKITVEESGP